MQWRGVRRVRRAFCLSRPFRLLALAAVAASANGCSMQLASLGPAGGSTVTFESIDGPPPEVFSKLVATLNDEAGLQKVAVVSRTAPATYRVRGYMSALVGRNKTSFGWVWDVYDADKNRVLRISGEEPATPAGRRQNAWAAADEQVLRGMSRNGMERIAAFLNSDVPAPAAIPEPALVTMASARDDSPEAAGIFRLFGSDRPPAVATSEPDADVPLPPHRPKAKKHPASTVGAAAPGTQATALVTRR
jgi:hypothetical protein